MQSSNSDANVQVQAQAAVNTAAEATPAFAEPVQAQPTSLMQGLQERAQAAAQVVKEQAGLMSQAASERVQTARAGKNLLDEGGEVAALAVVAKKASIDASDIDRIVSRRVELAIVTLDDSVAKLKSAESAQHTKDTAGPHDFAKIVAEHEERAAALRHIAHMLETPASSAEMSPEEFDALSIAHAKTSCATVISKTSAGLESVKQKTLASMSSVTTTAPKNEASSTYVTYDAPRPTLLQGLRDHFSMAGLQNAKQSTSDRIDTAKTGKRLLDDGGDSVAQLVVAKKATLEAAEIDRNVAQRVQSAICKLDDSVAKLRGIQTGQDAGDIISRDHAEKLADEHEMRAKTFRQIADMLKDPIPSLSMNLAEWDAHSFVKVREGYGVLHSRTNEGFEAVKSLAFTNCASEEGSEGKMRRIRTVCA